MRDGREGPETYASAVESVSHKFLKGLITREAPLADSRKVRLTPAGHGLRR